MKKKHIIWMAALAVAAGYSPLQAQTRQVFADRPNPLGVSKVGATVGFGVADMNLAAMNARLQELEIGRLEEMLTNINFSVFAGLHNGMYISMDGNFGIALESVYYSPNAWITLKTFSFGPTVYYPLITTNRLRVFALGGFRSNDMRFEYNRNTNASPDLNDLLTTPSSSSTVVLENVSNESLTLGGRFQYRLGKKENLKAREYSIGIDSGYNHAFSAALWREARSNYPVQNMPAIKADHFYLNFTFSAALIR